MKQHDAETNETAATRPVHRRLAEASSKLKTRLANVVKAHDARTASLRVYSAKRLDERSAQATPTAREATTEPVPAAARSPRARLLRRAKAAYAAHVARLIELRAFDRFRA